MKTKTTKMTVPDSYLRLIHRFPLRPIHNHDQYEAATALMRELAVRGKEDLDAGESDYLDALDEFISLYDRKNFSLGADNRSPLQRLQYLMQESGTTPIKLIKILGCAQSLVSMILNGRRELSKENIRKLSAYFNVEPGYFF